MAELNLYVYWNRMEEVQNEILELPIHPVVAGKNRHPVIRYLQADLFSLFFFSLQMSNLHEWSKKI